jgi:hypothetical protein
MRQIWLCKWFRNIAFTQDKEVHVKDIRELLRNKKEGSEPA